MRLEISVMVQEDQPSDRIRVEPTAKGFLVLLPVKLVANLDELGVNRHVFGALAELAGWERPRPPSLWSKFLARFKREQAA